MLHGKVATLGFLFSRNGERLFAYIPDAKTLKEETRHLIGGIDLLILDGLQHQPHPTHLSINEAIEESRSLKIGTTWLTHFSCRVDYAATEPGLPKNVRLAWDGLKLSIS